MDDSDRRLEEFKRMAQVDPLTKDIDALLKSRANARAMPRSQRSSPGNLP